ncbi:hypothetical protein AB1N83_006840 [Pleurotus pulmonarius]
MLTVCHFRRSDQMPTRESSIMILDKLRLEIWRLRNPSRPGLLRHRATVGRTLVCHILALRRWNGSYWRRLLLAGILCSLKTALKPSTVPPHSLNA